MGYHEQFWRAEEMVKFAAAYIIARTVISQRVLFKS